MTNVIEHLGVWVVTRVREMGRMLLFVLSAFAWLVRIPSNHETAPFYRV